MPKITIFIILMLVSPLGMAQIDWNKLLEPVVSEGMKQWEIPGLAIVIVDHGTVEYLKAFGFADLVKKKPVELTTVFAIGSTTKAFTSTAVAKVLSERSLSWDTRVKELWPEFQLKDVGVADQLTIRDILSHRTGLAGNDLVWYGNAITMNQLIEKIKYLYSAGLFRSDFYYNNLMYLLAGYLIRETTDQSWDDYLEKEFFIPLDMTSTFTDYNRALQVNNFAKPYAVIEDTLKPVPHINLNMVAPAGGIYSTIEDLSKWLLFLQNSSDLKESFEAYFEETQRPQINLTHDPFLDLVFEGSDFLSYGMGWFIHSYSGHKIVEHTGNTDGFSSHIALMPEKQIAVAILTNLNANFFSVTLKNKIFDMAVSKEASPLETDFFERFQEIFSMQKQYEEQKINSRKTKNALPMNLNTYLGSYLDNFYGEVQIIKKDQGLKIYFLDGLKGDLSHWHYNTFRITWENELYRQSFINFNLNDMGKVNNLTIDKIGLFPFGEVFVKMTSPQYNQSK